MKRTVLVISVCAAIAVGLAAAGVQDQGLCQRTLNLEKRMQFVAALPGEVRMWWGAQNGIPEGWEVCDGNEVTTPGAKLTGKKPNLVDRFPKGAPAASKTVADLKEGGNNNMVPHRHGVDGLAITSQTSEHIHTVRSKSARGIDTGDERYCFRAGANKHVIDMPGPEHPDANRAPVRIESSGGHTHLPSGNVGPKKDVQKVDGVGVVDGDHDTSGANQPAFCELFFIIRVK